MPTPPQLTAFTLARASEVNDIIQQGFNLVITKEEPVTAALTVTVTHNSGYYPFVGAVDALGVQDFSGAVVHAPDKNSFTVTWGTPFTGVVIYK